MTRRELERLMELQTEALTARMLENASDMYLAFVVLGLALPLLYFTLFHAWRGQTPGKMAVGIRVVRETGERLGFGHALARYVVQAVLWWLLWLPGLVDSLWPLRDERKQSLHDKAAGTLVVRA